RRARSLAVHLMSRRAFRRHAGKACGKSVEKPMKAAGFAPRAHFAQNFMQNHKVLKTKDLV
ncbi:MAG: hypothetical protein AAGE94_21915, partial [Acidobacteriota bacterium]